MTTTPEGRASQPSKHRQPHPELGRPDGDFIALERRLLDILEPTQQTLDALMKLDLSAGVDVEIKT